MEYRSPLQGNYDEPGPSNRHSPWRFSPYSRPPRPSFPHPRNGIEYPPRTPFSEYGALSRSLTHNRAPEKHHFQESKLYLEQINSSKSQSKYSKPYKPVNYPAELTSLFESLECHLCGVEATTPIVAKMHYGGKQHKKKVKQYLLEWCEKTGLPMPDLESAAVSSNQSALPDLCNVCGVRLISDSDKLQHFSGKTHQKNLADPTRKKKKALETTDPTNRFGIGLSFSTVNSIPGTSSDATATTEMNTDDFVCRLCNVKAVSYEQLEVHLQGKKHKHNEEKSVSSPDPSKQYKCSLCKVALTTPDLFDKHMRGKKHAKNLVKRDMEYMDYSCTTCNLSFTSYEPYFSHMQGRKHEKKLSEASKKPVQLNSERCSLVCEFCPFVGNVDEHDCDGSLADLTEDDLKDKVVCKPCFNMPFENEEDYKNHLLSRRHFLCTVNSTDGDEMVPELMDYYCRVCKKQYMDHKTYSRHLIEETHMSLSLNQPMNLETSTQLFHCSVCKIMIDAQGYNEHMRNKKHLKQALINDTMNTIKKLSHEDIATSNFLCKNCNVTLSSFVEYTGHVLSEDHLDTMIRAKLDGTL